MRLAALVSLALLWTVSGTGQAIKKPGDAAALLKQVAAVYAQPAETFHVESETEIERRGALEHDWQKTVHKIVKGPGALFRIETRSPYGSYVMDSDGSREWTLLVEGDLYTERPLRSASPVFPSMGVAGNWELRAAWETLARLEELAASYQSGALLPEETVHVGDRTFPCFVVRVTDRDRVQPREGLHTETTMWIDKKDLVFRKVAEHNEGALMVSPVLRIPSHADTTTVYPVVELHPVMAEGVFAFVPPATARLVDSLVPAVPGAVPALQPAAQWVGRMAPEVSLVAADGSKVPLRSFRGRPVVLDLWATWCAACVEGMPSLARIVDEAKGTGLTVLTADADAKEGTATAFLARHHYDWQNYSNADGSVERAFKAEGIPFTVLIDATGGVVYAAVAGKDEELRRAIATLGPEYRRFAAATAVSPAQASTRP